MSCRSFGVAQRPNTFYHPLWNGKTGAKAGRPSPLSRGKGAEPGLPPQLPLRRHVPGQGQEDPFPAFLAEDFSSPGQCSVGRLSRTSNLKPTESCADPASELHTCLLNNSEWGSLMLAPCHQCHHCLNLQHPSKKPGVAVPG